MFDFLKSADKRILLINFEGLSVYSLHNKLLVHITKFSDEDSGYESFRHYLSDSPKSPVTLLVDSIAEDFLVESVVHVRPYDRKEFLNRKSNQHFRGTDYRSGKIIDREKFGHRNDRVLFSAISKNQYLEPWVRALMQEQIPIKSITTPAFALCKVAEEFSFLTSKAVLLVNWELSGIRQTYIVDRKMMFSRLTPSPHDLDANLATAIIESCNQSKAYLERIELLQYDQLLDVHIITPHLDDDAFADEALNRNFRVVMHHNSIDLMQTNRFSGPQEAITAILLCLDWGVRKGELKNIYAPSAAMRWYHLGQARKYIAIFSLAILVLGGITTSPLVLDGLSRRSNSQQFMLNIVPVQAQYDALRAQFPETPIPSAAMELVVQTYDLIRSQVQSPTQLLTAISQVMAEYPAIELSSLQWRLSDDQDRQDLTTVLLAGEAVVNLEIYGALVGSSSIQDSDTQLRVLIDALNQIAGVTVSTISLPVEPGPEFEVTTIIDDELVDAEFALNLKLET